MFYSILYSIITLYDIMYIITIEDGHLYRAPHAASYGSPKTERVEMPEEITKQTRSTKMDTKTIEQLNTYNKQQ